MGQLADYEGPEAEDDKSKGWNKLFINVSHYVYRDFLSCRNKTFSEESVCYFSYICSKHRFWVHVKTASRRDGSNEYPQSMLLSKNKKTRYTPAYPSFTI